MVGAPIVIAARYTEATPRILDNCTTAPPEVIDVNTTITDVFDNNLVDLVLSSSASQQRTTHEKWFNHFEKGRG